MRKQPMRRRTERRFVVENGNLETWQNGEDQGEEEMVMVEQKQDEEVRLENDEDDSVKEPEVKKESQHIENQLVVRALK